MDDEINHYAILGLPSGEEGAKLQEKEITKAYKKKALELHPDKRPNDQEAAHADIQRLNASYAILKDEKARKLLDDLLRAKLEKARRHSQHDSKRRKMMSDLERREREAFAFDPEVKARKEEERISRKFNEEVARIRAEHAAKVQAAWIGKVASSMEGSRSGTSVGGNESKTGGVDKEKVLKVSWVKCGVDYSAERLRVLFEKFGDVEDVVMRSTKKKGSALIIMASRDAVVAATDNVLGDLSNPLLVLPFQPVETAGASSYQKSSEPEGPKSGHLFGGNHKSFEASVLDKLRKAGEKQKLSSS